MVKLRDQSNAVLQLALRSGHRTVLILECRRDMHGVLHVEYGVATCLCVYWSLKEGHLSHAAPLLHHH